MQFHVQPDNQLNSTVAKEVLTCPSKGFSNNELETSSIIPQAQKSYELIDMNTVLESDYILSSQDTPWERLLNMNIYSNQPQSGLNIDFELEKLENKPDQVAIEDEIAEGWEDELEATVHEAITFMAGRFFMIRSKQS